MENKMNIALCLNSKYVMPSAVCLVSILENNHGPIDFYLLYSYLSSEELAFLAGKVKSYGEDKALIPIKIPDETFAAGPIHGRAREAYFRLLLPYLLPSNVDRCLYLDGDTIVQGSLAEFYTTDFGGHALLACEDIGEMLFYHKERHAVFGIPESFRYFNSGVLMFNLEYFRTQAIKLDAISDFIIQHQGQLKFLDQDVLNAMFYDKVKLVSSCKYDYLEILVSHLLDNDNMEKATIVHFLQKPWRFSYNGVNASYWWKYGRKVYPAVYWKFVIVNFMYRKALAIIMLFFSVRRLKKIKQAISRWR